MKFSGVAAQRGAPLSRRAPDWNSRVYPKDSRGRSSHPLLLKKTGAIPLNIGPGLDLPLTVPLSAGRTLEAMKHIIFPTVADADAFIADLQTRGVVQPEVGTVNVNRRTASTTTTTATTAAGVSADPAADDAAAGAVKGTGVGAAVGATAGVLGAAGVLGTAAATAATGGLALPLILGLTALGSGVGAAVGAAGGAMGVDETGDGRTAADNAYALDDSHYDHLHTSVSGGGRAVAVDDHVPSDVLDAAVRAHNGQYVTGTGTTV